MLLRDLRSQLPQIWANTYNGPCARWQSHRERPKIRTQVRLENHVLHCSRDTPRATGQVTKNPIIEDVASAEYKPPP